MLNLIKMQLERSSQAPTATSKAIDDSWLCLRFNHINGYVFECYDRLTFSLLFKMASTSRSFSVFESYLE